MQVRLMRRASLWSATGIYAQGGKRVFDLCCVSATAPIWVSLICVLWFVSWLEARQGFYQDHCVGQNGRAFRCLKIRTMVRGTSRQCAAYKRCDDPRITKIGRFMRRSSLDELPQLICVLKGEMSLVGPRPVPSNELNRYGMAKTRYLSVRPGLTGLWQVSGRNALPYKSRIAMDVRYANGLSLRGDMAILLATCREVWRMSGR